MKTTIIVNWIHTLTHTAHIHSTSAKIYSFFFFFSTTSRKTFYTKVSHLPLFFQKQSMSLKNKPPLHWYIVDFQFQHLLHFIQSPIHPTVSSLPLQYHFYTKLIFIDLPTSYSSTNQPGLPPRRTPSSTFFFYKKKKKMCHLLPKPLLYL